MLMPHVAHLTSRALIAIGGEDWRPFLHNLLTQDVETLAPGQIRFAGLLTPQGKLLFDLFVLGRPDEGEGDGGFIDCDADRRLSLIQRLSMYRLRAKVHIEPHDGAVLAAWGQAPGGEGWSPDPRLAGLGWRAYALPVPDDALGEADYQAHRLSLGVPDPDGDCPPDKTYPIEANFDLLGGIDFKKGCFVGQETTSRMKRRGQIKNRMLPITYEGAPPPFGAEVLAGELRAGEVLQGRAGRAMALLRLDRIEGAALTVDGRPVSAETPAWWPAD